MDWPTASVVLGVIASVAVAIIKLVPNRNGSEYLKDLRQRIARLEGEHERWVKLETLCIGMSQEIKRVSEHLHDIRNRLMEWTSKGG